MPVAKPSQTADWATTAAGGDIAAPTSGKQLTGWLAEPVPHTWLNWWMNLVGDWTDYVDNPAPATPVHPTQQNGYSDLFGAQTLQYWTSNGEVHIAGSVVSTGGTANALLVWAVGVLPSALRPALTVYRPCNIGLHGGGTESGFVKVYADGSMDIHSASGGSIGQADICLTFIPGI